MTEDNDEQMLQNTSSTMRKKCKPNLLLFATIIANLNFVSIGLVLTWPSPFLPKLQDGTEDLLLTPSQGSWIASISEIGASIGLILSAVLLKRIGRKLLICLVPLTYILGWSIIFFVRNFVQLLIGRSICGLGYGMTYGVIPIYVSEIAETNKRGALGVISLVSSSIGALITYTIGHLVPMKTFTVICAIPSLLLLLLSTWIPETPFYYMEKNSIQLAKQSLSRLRGSDYLETELDEIRHFVETEKENSGSIIGLITVPRNRRATFIVWTLLSAQQLSGATMFLAYTDMLLIDIPITVNKNTISAVISLSGFAGTLLSVFLIDKIGRKCLFLLGSCTTTVCLGIMAIFFHLKYIGIDVESITWLPTCCLITHFCVLFLSAIPIPVIVISEIYTTNMKPYATMCLFIYGSLLSSCMCKMYEIIYNRYGYHTLFYSLSLCVVLFGILIFLFVPETKCKSFKEIQDYLRYPLFKSKRSLTYNTTLQE